MSDYTESGAAPVDDAVADDPPTVEEVVAARDRAHRSTHDVLEDHLGRRRAGDLEGDLRDNYAEDVVVLSAEGTHRGHDGVRHLASILRSYVPKGGYRYEQVLCAGEVGMLQWTAEAAEVDIHDGADSYVVRDGRIVAQTIHYSVAEEHPDRTPG